MAVGWYISYVSKDIYVRTHLLSLAYIYVSAVLCLQKPASLEMQVVRTILSQTKSVVGTYTQ